MNRKTISKLSVAGATVAAVLNLTGPLSAHATSMTGTGTALPPANGPVLSSGAQDILKLARAKVSDDVTLAFIQNSDRRYDLTAGEIIQLREAGVTDRVLATMIAHQPEQVVASQPAAPAATTAPAPVAAAPQYIEAPATTATLETAPSTVYVVPGNTSYYYADPWPYYSYSYSSWWYNPWPYYWGWGWGWGYPYYSCGWYWNDCHDNNNHWNDCDNNKNNWDSRNGNSAGRNGAGDNANSGRTPATRSGGGDVAGQSSALASTRRPTAGLNQTTASGDARSQSTRQARPTPAGRNANTPPTLQADNQQADAGQANRSVPARNSTSDSVATSATASRNRGLSGTSTDGVNPRTVVTRPSPGQNNNAQLASASATGARPTSTWSGNNQAVASRSVTSRGPVAVAPISRSTTTGPTTSLTRIGSQPASRSAAGPAMNYQRSGNSYASARPSAGGSYSRPTMSAPSRSMSSPSSFRGSGGGMSGGGAARPSMGGGGFRGGGGGGRSR